MPLHPGLSLSQNHMWLPTYPVHQDIPSHHSRVQHQERMKNWTKYKPTKNLLRITLMERCMYMRIDKKLRVTVTACARFLEVSQCPEVSIGSDFIRRPHFSIFRVNLKSTEVERRDVHVEKKTSSGGNSSQREACINTVYPSWQWRSCYRTVSSCL